MPIFGTRPEAIKMAPVLESLRAEPSVDLCTVVTAQHRDLLDDVLTAFDVRPDVDLDLMRPGQSATALVARAMAGLEPVLAERRPDWVLVQGDTGTVLAASIAAHYAGVKVGHIEAGLRSFDRANPFPEESNRVLTSHVSNLHFAPTDTARDNLLREGIPAKQIEVTGNPGLDALRLMGERDIQIQGDHVLGRLPKDRRWVLVTTHRRENFGPPLEDICAALLDLAGRPDIHLVLPLHPNPNVARVVAERLSGLERLTLCPPLDYPSLAWLLARVDLVLTDSGGLQEEAPSLGKPVLVLREKTERPEGVSAGTASLVGTSRSRIVAETTRLLDDPAAYELMARAINPYGDGFAAGRIVSSLLAAGDGERC